ncbi:hypothetical protein B0O99DRAFT_196904 [Bisporella sp. PMI_857]|nr:hypothetical protein B0O99DRAFT_196904 [Bisporella sp. PMI_857]
MSLMPLTRSIPPPFLLPEQGARRLYRALQFSTTSGRLANEDETKFRIRKHAVESTTAHVRLDLSTASAGNGSSTSGSITLANHRVRNGRKTGRGKNYDLEITAVKGDNPRIPGSRTVRGMANRMPGQQSLSGRHALSKDEKTEALRVALKQLDGTISKKAVDGVGLTNNRFERQPQTDIHAWQSFLRKKPVDEQNKGQEQTIEHENGADSDFAGSKSPMDKQAASTESAATDAAPMPKLDAKKPGSREAKDTKTARDMTPAVLESLDAEQSEGDTQKQDGIPQTEASSNEPLKPAPSSTKSLFEMLFPEEKKPSFLPKPPRKTEKLKPFQWNAGLVPPGRLFTKLPKTNQDIADFSKMEVESPTQDIEEAKARLGHEAKAFGNDLRVLLLTGASANLAESDFFRATPKGEHIEGWTTGIVKVIQGRDANTLKPLSHYFVLFSSEAAARAYLDQTHRLHKLARNHTSLVLPGTIPYPNFDPESSTDKDLNDIRSFSLFPGQGRFSMRPIKRPFTSAMKKLLNNGGIKPLMDLQLNGEGVVLFSLQAGMISAREVHDIIEADGKHRNLRWSLVQGRGIQEIEELMWVDRDEEQQRDLIARRKGAYTRPSSYVLSFTDRFEARRFAREWHRRQLPKIERYQINDVEEPPIVLAEFLS